MIRKIKKSVIQKSKITTITTVFLSMFFLTGCGTMNSKFDCPHKPGVMCRSLDQVNAMVDRGVFKEGYSQKVKDPKFSSINSKLGSTKISRAGQKVERSKRAERIQRAQKAQKPLRAGERVIKVWIAPYQDIQGNYHSESEIYTVARKNDWIVPKEIKEAL